MTRHAKTPAATDAINALDPYEDSGAPKLERPRFFPTLVELEVNLPAHQILAGGTGAVTAAFAGPFLKEPDGGGLGGANKGEVLLAVTSGEAMDFSTRGDRAGGLAQPSFEITGVSRSLGPIWVRVASRSSPPERSTRSTSSPARSGRSCSASYR